MWFILRGEQPVPGEVMNKCHCDVYQIRKQQKDHAELIEDYRTKQQQRPPHLGGPAVARIIAAPPGWTPGGSATGLMGQTIPSILSKGPQPPPAVSPGGPTGGNNGAAGDAAAAPPQVPHLELY